MNKKTISIFITCGLLLAAGIIYCITMNGCSKGSLLSADLNEPSDNIAQDSPSPSKAPDPVTVTTAAKKEIIYVHICGAVAHAGVYHAVQGTRVCDLIKLAGGLTKDAAGDYINQAEQVSDGQRIYIPTDKEVKDMAVSQLVGDNSEVTGGTDKGLVNINTANAEELMTLPGIGQAKADSIINFRTEHGRFQSIDELMSIPGIKNGVFNRISSLITV